MAEKWVKITIDANSLNIEEVGPESEPWIRFICEPHEHLHDIRCEMEAVVPMRLKDEIINVWSKRDELDVMELANILIGVIYEVDDNPYIRIEFDNYETRIEINPPD